MFHIYIYPLDIWVVSINSTNEYVLLLTLFDPRLNTNPSLKLIPSFGLPGRQLKNVEAMTLAFMLIIMKLETLKRVHPFKSWHPPTKDGFSSNNFQHHTPVYDFAPPPKKKLAPGAGNAEKNTTLLMFVSGCIHSFRSSFFC